MREITGDDLPGANSREWDITYANPNPVSAMLQLATAPQQVRRRGGAQTIMWSTDQAIPETAKRPRSIAGSHRLPTGR